MSKLYRSPDDIIVAGVFGGIGEYLKINSDILRVGFVILALATGSIFGMAALYLVGVFLLPKRDPNEFNANYSYSDTQGSADGNTYTSENFKKTFDGFGKEFKQKKEAFNTEGNHRLLGYILIAIGVYVTFSRIAYLFSIDGSLAPVVLIVVGLAVLFNNDRRKKNEE